MSITIPSFWALYALAGLLIFAYIRIFARIEGYFIPMPNGHAFLGFILVIGWLTFGVTWRLRGMLP